MATCASRTVKTKFQHQGASHMSSRSLWGMTNVLLARVEGKVIDHHLDSTYKRRALGPFGRVESEPPGHQ